jgi:hypothetical protein
VNTKRVNILSGERKGRVGGERGKKKKELPPFY